MQALGFFVPLCNGEGCRGKRQGEKTIRMCFYWTKQGEKASISAKKCSRREHSRVVRDVGRTELGLQKSREKTDGDHGVLKL